MEGQTQTATPAPEAGAAAPAPSGDTELTHEALGSMSEGDYGRARSEYVAKNGPGSWERFVGQAPTEPVKTEAKPAPTTEVKPNGEAKPSGEDGEAIEGEITINADGKPIDTKTGRFIPRSAYLRVKGEAQEHKTTAESLKAEVIRARERLSIFEEASKPKEPAAEPAKPVDPKEDIFGAFEVVMSRIKELEGKLDSTTKTTAETLAEQRNKEAFQSDVRRFAQSEPAFVDAFTFLREQYDKELEVIGISDKDQRDAKIMQDLRAFVTETIGNKRSPAELLFKRAVARGFQAKPVQPAGETEAQKAAREEIERINAGKAASASLGGSGGGGVGEQLTRDKVATMPEGDYYNTRTAYIAKHGKAAWEKLISQ